MIPGAWSRHSVDGPGRSWLGQEYLLDAPMEKRSLTKSLGPVGAAATGGAT